MPFRKQLVITMKTMATHRIRIEIIPKWTWKNKQALVMSMTRTKTKINSSSISSSMKTAVTLPLLSETRRNDLVFRCKKRSNARKKRKPCVNSVPACKGWSPYWIRNKSDRRETSDSRMLWQLRRIPPSKARTTRMEAIMKPSTRAWKKSSALTWTPRNPILCWKD